MSTVTKSRSPASKPAKRSGDGGGGGGFWLLIAVVVLSVGGVFIFAPDLPRQWLGLTKPPQDKGPEPTTPQTVKTDLAGKEHTVDDKLAKPELSKVEPKPVIVAPPVEKPKTFSDDTAAKPILELAQKAYTEMKWQKASTEARRVSSMAVSPQTRIKAQDIITGSAAIEKLFLELNDKDELIRYYDTHPSLVLLKNGGSVSYAVPIQSMDNPIPIEGRPLEFILAQRKIGKVAFMIKGKKDYMAGLLAADNIGEVEEADHAAMVKEKQSEFESRLNRLRNGALARDPLAWYDAGKFAYRNRIDSQVTAMLDQAVILEPNLVSRVREDKAAGLYASVISHLKNNNRKQAEGFMAVINRRFADTDQGKQAKLYFNGNNAELVKAAKAEQARRKEEEQQRRTALKQRATALDDKKALAQIQTQDEEPEDAALVAVAASGDEGKADQLFTKGRDLYNKALDAGNTPERDVLYEKAYQELHSAKAIYSKLADKNPGNDGIGFKLIECNKLHYGTLKQRRFH